MDYQKVKSVSKDVVVKGTALQKVVLDTMQTIRAVVGATLGPGGMPVLIERFEHGMPPMVTKDGVTVFRALGFDNPSAHVVMEAARDAAVRTAGEAGDGTTTATVLAETVVRLTAKYCRDNPKVSPQRVTRRLEALFREDIEPAIKQLSTKADSSTEKGKKLLRAVAKVSANGDSDLADAVMECLDLVGDDGNVTILEVSGPSKYEVERIDGFPVETGYEDSCGKFYPKFINDPATQRCVLDEPVFVLYHGRITEIQTVQLLMEQVGSLWGQGYYHHHNVVIFATGYSESVLGQLAVNFAHATTINVLPMLVPKSPLTNGQLQFLEDLAAVTGATIFDPLNNPLESVQIVGSIPEGLDKPEVEAHVSSRFAQLLGPGVKQFEVSRYRASIMGRAEGTYVADDGKEYSYEDLLAERAMELQALIEKPESQLDAQLLQERLGKLTNGIAKLKVVGSSNGELREKRDRAEDAVCAVRGAIKHGCVPGGGWVLLKLASDLGKKYSDDNVVSDILIPALWEPAHLILSNCGFDREERDKVLEAIVESNKVYDALEGKLVDPYKGGILDSTPAVLEAIRNSLSIASLLGTLGGCVTFKRDLELERTEAKATQDFVRNANVNEADLRP